MTFNISNHEEHLSVQCFDVSRQWQERKSERVSIKVGTRPWIGRRKSKGTFFTKHTKFDR